MQCWTRIVGSAFNASAQSLTQSNYTHVYIYIYIYIHTYIHTYIGDWSVAILAQAAAQFKKEKKKKIHTLEIGCTCHGDF